MEALYLISSLLFIFLSLNFILKTQRFKSNIPPYPTTPLPLIGHLHLLKSPLHRKFHSISQSLNNSSIFSLRLGTRLVLVVSSYSIAEECFTKNDVVLANRPEFILGKYIGYNFTTMVGASYGNHWRNLRKIASVEIFSSHRLNTFLSLRQDEIQRLIFNIYNNTLKTGYATMDMSSLFTNLTLNNITRMVAGKRFYGNETDHDDEAKHVRQLISDVVASSGAGNAADYLPVLRWVTKYEKQVKKLSGRVDKFLQGLVDEIRSKKVKGSTMIDHLLCLQEVEPDYYTDVIIKGIMLVMILAGTDTSAGTLEWAMSNLLNHPEILQKARTEIETKIGLNRLIQESDIPNLPYLQNIVSETLRLYPVTPLLLPHVASEDCSISSYNVPRGTILLVNVWAIHRDPKVWEEAEKFKPERFEKKCEEQKLMSFGIGRRACPGSGLANRLVSSVIGSLVQCFDWERVGEEFIDMSECKQGTTMRKATSFQAICRVRPIVRKIINNSNP